MIYITGDTHGDMNRIVRFCERMETSQEDIMIILGDVGLNYYGDSRDRRNKEKVANLPITLFCIHGNHERRPTTIVEYKLQEWNGGKVWVEEAYPNILFAKDALIVEDPREKASSSCPWSRGISYHLSLQARTHREGTKGSRGKTASNCYGCK